MGRLRGEEDDRTSESENLDIVCGEAAATG
jgi:hypothetical protein